MSVVEKEPRKIPYDIRFEPAPHAVGKEADKILERAAKGDIFANLWEKTDALKNIQSYGPKLLTIDGLGPHLFGDWATGPDSADLWDLMPGQPYQINEEADVLVIAADSFDLRENTFLPPASPFEPYRKKLQAQIDLDWNANSPKGWSYSDGIDLQDAALISSVALLSMSLLKGEDVLSGRSSISRRNFLLGAGVYVGSLLVGADLVKKKVPKQIAETWVGLSPTNQRGGIWRDIVYGLGAKEITLADDWVAARNGLFVLKTKDAIDAFGPERSMPATILAGDGHIPGMAKLMASDDACREAILTYTEEMFRIIDYVAAQEKHKKHSFGNDINPTVPAEAKLRLVSLLSKYTASRAYNFPADFDKIPTRTLIFQGSHESKRVWEAFKDLDLPLSE